MSTWLERFVLGGVCTAGFVAIVVLDVMKLDWIQRSTLGGAIVLFSYFIGHTIEKKRGDSTPPTLASAPSLLPPNSLTTRPRPIDIEGGGGRNFAVPSGETII